MRSSVKVMGSAVSTMVSAPAATAASSPGEAPTASEAEREV